MAKVGTSKAGGTISQQAAVHPWLAADAHGNKQTNKNKQTKNKHTNKIQTNKKQTNKQTNKQTSTKVL
jgi:hypothetical protein